MFSAEGIRIAVCEKPLDAQFLSTLEMYDSTIKYLRIDADIASALKQESNVDAKEELVALFKKVSGNEKLKVEFADDGIINSDTPGDKWLDCIQFLSKISV